MHGVVVAVDHADGQLLRAQAVGRFFLEEQVGRGEIPFANDTQPVNR